MNLELFKDKLLDIQKKLEKIKYFDNSILQSISELELIWSKLPNDVKELAAKLVLIIQNVEFFGSDSGLGNLIPIKISFQNCIMHCRKLSMRKIKMLEFIGCKFVEEFTLQKLEVDDIFFENCTFNTDLRLDNSPVNNATCRFNKININSVNKKIIEINVINFDKLSIANLNSEFVKFQIKASVIEMNNVLIKELYCFDNGDSVVMLI